VWFLGRSLVRPDQKPVIKPRLGIREDIVDTHEHDQIPGSSYVLVCANNVARMAKFELSLHILVFQCDLANNSSDRQSFKLVVIGVK
jgi:hypothetical protein